MAACSRAHLLDVMRRRARDHVTSARAWREEIDAELTYFTPRQCRAYARYELNRAGCYRRRLLALMNEPGRYVTKGRYEQIMRGEW